MSALERYSKNHPVTQTRPENFGSAPISPSLSQRLHAPRSDGDTIENPCLGELRCFEQSSCNQARRATGRTRNSRKKSP